MATKAQTALQKNEDDKIYIKELQHYLHTLSLSSKTIPSVNIDGIFGSQTKAAVIAFQKENGLPPNGIVDKETWEAIFRVYLASMDVVSMPSSISPFPPQGLILEKGDMGDLVYIIQIMLNTLHNRFINIDEQRVNGRFDEGTQQAIRAIQSKSGLEPTGKVDKPTWNVLADAYNSYR